MAFQKLTAFTKKVADLADQPTLTPTELKAQFDAAPDELRQSFNTLVDDLNTLNPASKTQDSWTQATLQNGWTHQSGNPVEYRLNQFGQLELRGACTGGTTAGNTTVFTLPTSSLSTKQKTFRVMGTDNAGVTVNTSAMWIHATTGEIKGFGTLPYTIYFDGLVFSK